MERGVTSVGLIGRWAWFLAAIGAVLPEGGAAQPAPAGVTAVPGVRVGHHTLSGRPTGCTVVLVEGGAVAGVDVRGAAPGTRETDLLSPGNLVQQAHAVVLSGGSAFGLDAASGVVRYLEERRVGYDVGVARVPIVPAAILFDLGIGDPSVRPGADCGYRAATTATAGEVAEGSVGAGAGATVGKLRGIRSAMKGGVGTVAIRHEGGLIVAALVAVNAYGDIIDPATGSVVAGVRTADGRGLADARTVLRSGATSGSDGAAQNTTLGVVVTNARLTKAQANRIATASHDGFARAIAPAHTMYDGDVIFTLATGDLSAEPDMILIGALAADAVAEAVVRAVRLAEGLRDLPSVRDLETRPR